MGEVSNKKRYWLIAIIGLCMTYKVDAQLLKEINPENVVYTKEQSGDIRVHTNGYALAYNWGEIPTYYKTTYYHVELGRMFDPRESSQNRNIVYQFNRLSSSYKFGKQNDFFIIRLGKGVKRYVTDQAKRKGVAIGYNLEGGADLGILKPYYLELIYRVDRDGQFNAEIRNERYTPENADKFLNYESIYGRAPWSYGLKEISLAPGLHGKSSVFFALGSNGQFVKTLEAGIMLDVFVRKIPIMVETEAVNNRPYFLNLFVNLQFGKRK